MKTFALALLAVVLLGPSVARAQVAWDTPRLLGPESPTGFGAYWLRSSSLEEETDALMATWAFPGTGGAVVLRGGAGLDADDRLSAFGGLDLRAPITRHTDEQPLDLEWSAGVGAGGGAQDGQYVVVTVPMSVSAGRSWSSGSIWLAPYVSLGVALDFRVGEAAPEEEFSVTPSADIGVDLALDPSRNLVIRAATSLGDRQAVVVGLVIGGGP